MLLAKVTGNVVSTHKNKYLNGHKLLLVKKIDLEGNFTDIKEVIAIDFVSAGPGDTVIVTQEGDAVQQILGHGNAPVHSIIVGVVDKISVK
ncbi:MAG: EutN/CcmL family microcompartment protein [Ignavibacteriaceae bacterium]|nr:EutN/CcmL family microcompartment protein [Ignavibacteriaceae bacterium]